MAEALSLAGALAGGALGFLAGQVSRGLRDGWRLRRPDAMTWMLTALGAIIVWRHPIATLGPVHLAVIAGTVALLLLVSASDFRERAVYPLIVYPGVAAAIALAPWLGVWRIDAVKGAVAAVVFFLLVYLVARVISGAGAFGAGDVSVAALMGAVAGLSRIEPAILLLGISGGVMALAAAWHARTFRTSIPYAPALCIGALAATLT